MALDVDDDDDVDTAKVRWFGTCNMTELDDCDELVMSPNPPPAIGGPFETLMPLVLVFKIEVNNR